MPSNDEKLAELVRRLREFAQDNLESAILYGSAARGDFHESHSDLNVLCVLRSLSARELARVSSTVRWWCKDEHEPPPLFLSVAELRASADVFSIELLDMQQSRRVLYGADVIAPIAVPLNLHRIQVEHDLRTLLLKLRQHYLLTEQNEAALQAAASDSSSSVLALLRHALIDFDEPPPSNPDEVFTRVAALTGADASAFAAIYRLRDRHTHLDDMPRAYSQYINALSVVISALDKRIPKSHWQRAVRARD